MGKRLILVALGVLAVAGAHGQSLGEYLKLRRQLKISSPSSGSSLVSFVGQKAFEIRGSVNGLSTAGEVTLIMFTTEDDQVINIRTRNLPDWINANETVIRLLVKASRESDTSELSANFLGAAPDAQVPNEEPAAAAPARTSPRPGGNTTYRGGSPLRGSIGMGGARVESAPARTVPKSEATPIYANFIKNYNKRLSDGEAYHIAEGVIGFSLQYGVDARLIMAILIAESGFNPKATSRTGAMGLGQLMPATAQGLGISKPYDSMENLYGTVRTIRGHLERYNKQTGGDAYQSLILSLAAYNAGSGAVRKHGGVPPYAETQAYVRKVTSVYLQLSGQG